MAESLVFVARILGLVMEDALRAKVGDALRPGDRRMGHFVRDDPAPDIPSVEEHDADIRAEDPPPATQAMGRPVARDGFEIIGRRETRREIQLGVALPNPLEHRLASPEDPDRVVVRATAFGVYPEAGEEGAGLRMAHATQTVRSSRAAGHGICTCRNPARVKVLSDATLSGSISA